MADQLPASSVRFLTASGGVVGTGFLVAERSVLSCAHVVSAALEVSENSTDFPKDSVHLDFPLVARGQVLSAHVALWQPPQSDNGGDIALLYLDSDPPLGTRSVQLVMAEDLWEHSFRAFGFPDYHDEGMWAFGKMRGRQAVGWVQIEGVIAEGVRVQQGFSGGAVWDEQLDGVAGMVVAADRDAPMKVAYMIPTDVLFKAWPQLAQATIPMCPYRGLFAFQEKDAPFFFGREAFTAQLVEVVHQKPLSAIIGASGSGKSSVVFAGLLPRLRKEGNWLIANFRPGNRPFHSLAASLVSLLAPQKSDVDQLSESGKLAERLLQGDFTVQAVVERLMQKDPDTALLLVIDQFEELYTLCREAEVRQRFLDALLAASSTPSDGRPANFHLVITLRADFFGQALSYRSLADALQYADLILGPMTTEELQSAIDQPARQLNVSIEDGLTERILNDVSNQPGNLPLLEFALTTLWAKQSNRRLTHAAYNEIGGVERALADHAEEVYGKLKESEQQRAERIFVQLIRPGEGTGATRRIANRAEIGEDSWDLVVRLSNARLVVSGRDKASGEETVEIVHEALIRGWKRLREWIEENREFRTWQERLRTALHQWEASHQEKASLLRGVLLAEAVKWTAQHPALISPAEKEFIEASQQYQLEETQRWKEAYAKAERERQEAERQREKANRLRIEAEQQRAEANELRQVAEQEREEANRQRQKAEQEREEANRQRQEVERQHQVALARQLTAQAELMRNQHIGLVQRSVLLVLEAIQRSFSHEADQTLRASLALLPRPIAHLSPRGDGKIVALSNDGHYLLTVSKDAIVEVWDVTNDRQVSRLNSGSEVKLVAFSLDGRCFATVGVDYMMRVWETISGRPLARLNNEGDVKAITLSRSGRYLASTSGDGSAKIWDIPGSTQLARVAHEDILQAMTFSLDGRCLATASMDCNACVWETISGRQLAKLSHNGRVNAVVFSPNGRYLATGSDDSNVRIWAWEAANNKQVVPLPHEYPVNAITFTTDSSYLATASKDNAARIWSTTTGRQIIGVSHEGSVNALAFSPDGRYLATTSADRTVGVWDANSGYRVICLPHNDLDYKDSDYIHTVAFGPDGHYLITASNNGAVGVWEVVNNRLRHKKAVTAISFNSRGKHLATGSEDGTASIWEVSSGHLHTRLTHGGTVWSVRFSRDGHFLATASEDGTAGVWETDTGRRLLSLSHTKNVNALDFSPDGRYLATASGDYAARVWEVSSGRQLVSLMHGGNINAVSFSPQSTYLATASDDGTARVWEIGSGRQLAYLQHRNIVSTVVFNSDGYYLATASWDHTARIWKIGSERELFRLSHESKVWDVAFSPDSKYVATASNDHTARVWDFSNGKQLFCLRHEESVDAIAFSPNGTYLATASADRTARIWHTSSGRQLAYFIHEDGVNAVAFSPDGKYIATASKNAILQIWLWRPQDIVEEAQSRLIRNLTQKEWQQYLGKEPYRQTCPHLPAGS